MQLPPMKKAMMWYLLRETLNECETIMVCICDYGASARPLFILHRAQGGGVRITSREPASREKTPQRERLSGFFGASVRRPRSAVRGSCASSTRGGR